MKKILLIGFIISLFIIVGCAQEPEIDPQSIEDVTEEDLEQLPEDLQPQPEGETALVGQAAKWYDCKDPDASSTFDKQQLSVKSTTTFEGGSRTDRCYTWYAGTPNEKTRLIEGICRKTRAGDKFNYWYADCNRLGDYECVEGACVMEAEEVCEKEWSIIKDGLIQANGIWGTSPTNIYVAGRLGKIYHYDGNSWTEESTGTSSGFLSIWGSSANDIYAVGGHFGSSTIVHYDGSGWTQMLTPACETSSCHLFDIWGTTNTDIYAVGSSGTILHYDGTSWTKVESGTSSLISNVWGTSSTNLYAAAYTSVIHYDGTIWSESADLTNAILSSIWGSDQENIYATSSVKLFQYDGTDWSEIQEDKIPIELEYGSYLYDVKGTSSEDVYIVGQNGLVLHFDGSNWQEMESNTVAHLGDIWVGTDEIYAVGNVELSGANWNGTVVRYGCVS